MKSQSIVFAVAGAFFGFIVGWILGAQYSTPGRSAGQAPVAAVQQAATPEPAAAPIDASRVSELRADIQRDPKSVQARVQLGNLYFDAKRYDEAAKWYEEAIALDPKDVSVSTDLGVCYYYLNQPDRALQQFDRSLSLDGKHLKTLLNQGVVRAFGKQDLEGATASWQKVIDLSPGSEEGQTAKRMLDDLKSAHPGGATAPAGQTPRG
jgi:tetratricopeptide (TPR) repeat protein